MTLSERLKHAIKHVKQMIDLIETTSSLELINLNDLVLLSESAKNVYLFEKPLKKKSPLGGR